MVVPVVRSYLGRAFPWPSRWPDAPDAAVAKTEEDRREIEGELDLVVWSGEPVEIGGKSAPSGLASRRAARRRSPGSSWSRTA